MHSHPCPRAKSSLASWFTCLVFGFVVLITSSRTALADCPVEDWLSGQVVAGNVDGAVGGDGDGIGGSGRAPGSGGDEDGIGGSGIFGTVTAFGSICINGRRVLYDDAVAVTVDGRSGSIEDLAVGHVVFVEVVGRRDERRAISIDAQHVLIGPVTAIAQDVVEVMGERIGVDSALFDESGPVEIGTRLAVSGLRNVTGMVVASRIDLAISVDRDLVRGSVVVGEDGQRRIGGIRVLTRKMGSPPRPILSGKRERRLVRGEWNAGVLRLEADHSTPSPTMLSGSDRFDVEGYVRRISSDEIQIGDARFSNDVRLRDSGVASGDRVRVRGLRSRDDGSLRVISVQRVPVPVFLRSLDRSQRGSGVMDPGMSRSGGAGGAGERRVDGQRERDRERQADRSGRPPENRPIDRPRDYRIDHRPERPDRPAPRQDLIDGRKAVDRP